MKRCIMKKCFDLLNRKNTDCMKWDTTPDDATVPMWVADMDFQTVPSLLEKLKDRVAHGCFGYAAPNPEYYTAVTDWYAKHQNWQIKSDWILAMSGVLPALGFIVQTCTEKGDNIIIQEPVYYPFKVITEVNHRNVSNNALIEKDGEYFIDFEDLEKRAADPKTKLMIFCTPHNPVGRIWTKDEITKTAEICKKHNVIMVADEIHSDIVFEEFYSCGQLPETLLHNTIICTAPSKTFNLASLHIANIIIPDTELRENVTGCAGKVFASTTPSMLGNVTIPAVYSKDGEEWLDTMLSVVRKNYSTLQNALKDTKIKLHKLDATYLAWMDFRGTGLRWEEIEDKMKNEAKLMLNPGSIFGESGRGFMRINIACHESTLQTAIDRILKTFN